MSSINFKSKGDGLPIIFLHGFCESLEIWDSFIPEIADDFKKVAVDLPGFGSSPLLKPHFSIDEIGQHLNAWVTSNGLENSIIIGHSLGGYVALSMVAQNAELYTGLCLFHSTSRADTPEKKVNRGKVIEFVRANGVQKFVDSFIPGLYHQKDHPSISKAHQIASTTPESTFIAYTEAMRDRPSTEHVLKTAKLPILIIAGQNDQVIDLVSLKEQALLNPQIKFYAIDNAAHMGFFEARNEAALVVNRFINEVRP